MVMFGNCHRSLAKRWQEKGRSKKFSKVQNDWGTRKHKLDWGTRKRTQEENSCALRVREENVPPEEVRDVV